MWTNWPRNSFPWHRVTDPGYRSLQTVPFLLFPFSLHVHLDGVELSVLEIRQAVQNALAEDIGSGDATTLATVPETTMAQAVMCAREPLVVAGLAFAEIAFTELSPAVSIERLARDGQPLKAGE